MLLGDKTYRLQHDLHACPNGFSSLHCIKSRLPSACTHVEVRLSVYLPEHHSHHLVLLNIPFTNPFCSPSKRHMCVQLRLLSSCTAAEGLSSYRADMKFQTLSLPNTLLLLFSVARGCMEIGSQTRTNSLILSLFSILRRPRGMMFDVVVAHFLMLCIDNPKRPTHFFPDA